MGWIQDIVPNHMAFDGGNRHLAGRSRERPRSPCAGMFDIDWDGPACGTPGRVLVPVLAAPYGICLERGDIAVALDAGGWSVRYAAHRFPLRQESWAAVFGPVLGLLLEKSAARGYEAFRSILLRLEGLGGGTAVEIGEGERTCLDETLRDLCRSDGEVRESLDKRLREVNGAPGNPESFDVLDGILSRQYYRLAHWRVAPECVNYRRFFDINDLIGVRVEDDDAFRLTHDLVGPARLAGVDHGPARRSRRRALRPHRISRAAEAMLPRSLHHCREDPRAGAKNCPGPGRRRARRDTISERRQRAVRAGRERSLFRPPVPCFTGWTGTYGGLLAEKKRLVLERLFAADLDRLTRLAERVARGTRRGRDLTGGRLRGGLAQILTAIPRLPDLRGAGADPRSRRRLHPEGRGACPARMPGHGEEIDFLEALLLDEARERPGAPHPGDAREWRMRFQQLTPPLAAKGFEDTLLYVYNRLMSLNEVGGHPDRFGSSVRTFSNFSGRAASIGLHGLNATATHDTKRGEDHRHGSDACSPKMPRALGENGPALEPAQPQEEVRRCRSPAPDRNLST
jgi:(1->4)-alpha-D-glucan 1-alpha-D-glucosylmutase